MATEDTHSPPADPLLRAIIATEIALTAALALLALFGASRLEPAQVPSFVVMVHGFMLLAALCIAFANDALCVVFYILDWPGLRGDGRSLIGPDSGKVQGCPASKRLGGPGDPVQVSPGSDYPPHE
jgi:hypothetical protein